MAPLSPFPLETSPLLPTWTPPALVPPQPLDQHHQHGMAVLASRELRAAWECCQPQQGLVMIQGISPQPGGRLASFCGQTQGLSETPGSLPEMASPAMPQSDLVCLSLPPSCPCRRSHLPAKDSAQSPTAPMGRAGTRAEPSSFAAVRVCSI